MSKKGQSASQLYLVLCKRCDCKSTVVHEFYVLLTVHLIKIFVNNQFDAQFFFLYLFIPLLYMFRTTMCSSSGESIVSIRPLVYVTIRRWPCGMQVQMELQFHLNLDTIDSPDDEHMVARNMQRTGINKYQKKSCGSNWLFTNKLVHEVYCSTTNNRFHRGVFSGLKTLADTSVVEKRFASSFKIEDYPVERSSIFLQNVDIRRLSLHSTSVQQTMV